MAHGETTAETNQVVPISGNYVFSAEDAVAAIQTGWVGAHLGHVLLTFQAQNQSGAVSLRPHAVSSREQ